MTILVDCRCLNYPYFTGINAYTIRLLHTLYQIKEKSNSNLHITALGIKVNAWQKLVDRFEFVVKLFDEQLTMQEYLSDYTWTNRVKPVFKAKVMELEILVRKATKKNLFSDLVPCFNFIICPQPRILPIHHNSKLITVFHDIYAILTGTSKFPQNIIYSRNNCQKIINTSQVIITNSICTANDLVQTFQNCQTKIQTIYPALPNLREIETNKESHQKTQETNQKTQQNKPKPNYILALSGFEQRKNWKNLVLAHHYLNQNYNWSTQLVLAGSIVDKNYHRDLQKLIQKYKIQNIIWAIEPTENEKNILLKNCLFLAYPSFYEGFGFPILEAQQHNKIVLTSRVSSMPEIGKDSCLYINPFDYIDIANGFLILTKDPRFVAQLEQNIHTNKVQYSWNELYQKLSHIIKN